MWQGYNTLGLYAQAVGMVERYSDHADDLTSYLATFPGDTGFTPKDQIDEEELKAWLRANAPQWSEPLHKAEEIPIFRGENRLPALFRRHHKRQRRNHVP